MAFYNRNAIFVSTVLYAENMLSTIFVSTIPPGRSPEFEVFRLANVER
jgi:hypothetical protein